jgi:hypothetical protein
VREIETDLLVGDISRPHDAPLLKAAALVPRNDVRVVHLGANEAADKHTIGEVFRVNNRLAHDLRNSSPVIDNLVMSACVRSWGSRFGLMRGSRLAPV